MMRLEELTWDVDNCARCSLCKWVDPWEMKSGEFSKICPAVARYLFDSYSCQGKMDIGKAVNDGMLDIKSSDTIADIIYTCMLCGACDIMCKRSRDMEPLMVFKALRAKLWEEGLTPKPLQDISKSVNSYDNVWLSPRSRRSAWAKGLDLVDAGKKPVDVLFFAGCTYSYQPKFSQVIRTMAQILNKSGVSFGILGANEICCGSPLEKIGDLESFHALARKNLEIFKKAGVKTIVSPCPGCSSTFRVDYAKIAMEQGLDMDFTVWHITEYLEKLIRKGSLKPKKKVDMKVAYHDPCHLGRLSEPYIPWEGVRGTYGRCTPPKEMRRGNKGTYDPPRDLIRAIPGLKLVEMERIRENSWCCGSGGGVKTFNPGFAQWSAGQRVDEARSTGAEALLTSCPWCEQNLGEAGKDNMPVHNLVEILGKALT